MGTETRFLLKDDGEHQLPLDWQTRFEWIISRLVEGDFNFSSGILDVEAVSVAEQGRFAENIGAYGDKLASLNPAVWQSSIYA